MLKFQLHDEEFSLGALNNLVWCMTKSTGCCTAVTPVPVTTCQKTQGPFGELINAWPTHPAIGATSAINNLPVDPASVKVIVAIFFSDPKMTSLTIKQEKIYFVRLNDNVEVVKVRVGLEKLFN